MTYEIRYTSRFKKEYRLMARRGVKMGLLHDVIELLRQGQPLPERYHDHPLTGEFVGHRECHIRPDWLLVYFVRTDVLVLTLTRTGTHADLFE